MLNLNKPGKIRVVFDAAAKYNGVCLNDLILSGPDSSCTLLGVLLRGRVAKVAVLSDICAMFNNCGVILEDCDSLRFLWYDESGEVCDYQMNVHVFGAADSRVVPTLC